LADVLAECRVLPCSWLLLHACNMLLLPGALHAVLLLPLWQCVSQVVVAAAVAAPFFVLLLTLSVLQRVSHS